MSSRTAKVVVALAVIAVLALIVFSAGWFTKGRPPAGQKPAADATAIATDRSDQSDRSNKRLPTADPSAPSPAALQLNSPNSTIAADLQIVANVLEAFRTNFPVQGNPVGENSEITAALAGDNTLHVAFIPRSHPAIDQRGALCDRWGTPFFFHQISGVQMEIRSAGPDRKLWTGDDVVLSP